MGAKLKKFMNGNVFITLLIIIFICITLLLGTYAWFTWSSQDNVELTMTIGNIADVTFSNGNDITARLTPVYNYYDGVSTSFKVNNKAPNTSTIMYDIKLNLTTIPEIMRSTDVKYTLTKNGQAIREGDLSGVADGTSITIFNSLLASDITEYELYLYIDGNVENDRLMQKQTIIGNVMVEAYEVEPTPISSFDYQLTTDDYGNQIPSDEVYLTSYIGEDSTVIVPNVYIIDGVEYKSVLRDYQGYYSKDRWGVFSYSDVINSVYFSDEVSFVKQTIGEEGSSYQYNISFYTFSEAPNLTNVPEMPSTVEQMDSTFLRCANLVNAPVIPEGAYNLAAAFYDCGNLIYVPELPSSAISLLETFAECTSLVTAPDIPDSVTNVNSTFYGCTSLINAPDIPDSVTVMSFTFYDCTSLVEAPDIPDSVTTTLYTFSGCTSLVIAPDIPDSVTVLSATFYGCTSLVEAPDIPSSVTSMSSTFYGCTSLVEIPKIPASVTIMNSVFNGCTSLTGDLIIESDKITYANNFFSGTVNNINVIVPKDSTTYDTFSGLTLPSNVKLSTY